VSTNIGYTSEYLTVEIDLTNTDDYSESEALWDVRSGQSRRTHV
jgi:hypothetical protein